MTNFSIRSGRWTTAAALLGLAAGLAASVQANACVNPEAPARTAVAGFSPAVFRPGTFNVAAFTPVFDEWRRDEAPIVGLWKFEMRLDGAQGPFADKYLLDWGTAVWHDDGTEVTISGGRPTFAGDVCMGAWRQLRSRSFQLSHIALGLAPPDFTAFIGPVAIRMTVRVDASGDHYSGRFTLKQYLGSTDAGTEMDISGTPVGVFSGNVTATRVDATD